VIIAYLLKPVTAFAQRRLERTHYFKKKGRSAKAAAVILTIVGVFVLLLLGLSLIVSALSHEVTVISLDGLRDILDSISKSLQSVCSDLKNWLNQMNFSSQVLEDSADSVSTALGGIASGAGKAVTGFISHLTGFFANLLIAVVIAVYFLIDEEGLKAYWNRAFKAISPRRFYETFHIALQDADKVFSGYIRGQLVDAAFMAVVVSIALLFLNVKFAVIIGLLTGIGNLIPYVGPFVAYGLSAFACILEPDIKKLIICIVVLFIIQTIDGQIVNPRLLSNAIEVHPMLVVVALLFGSAIGGLLGMLLAVPVAALLKIWFDRFVDMAGEAPGRVSGPADDRWYGTSPFPCVIISAYNPNYSRRRTEIRFFLVRHSGTAMTRRRDYGRLHPLM